jgi:hypothetical protein
MISFMTPKYKSCVHTTICAIVSESELLQFPIIIHNLRNNLGNDTRSNSLATLTHRKA